MAAQRELQIRKKKDEAYSNLIWDFWPNQPPVGVYRNLRGDFLKIVQIDDDFNRYDPSQGRQVHTMPTSSR